MSNGTEESTQQDSDTQSLGSETKAYIEGLSVEFDTLRALRHEVGAEEYGEVAFLKAPLVRMAAEELADLCNYARYMYIKLRIMEDTLDAGGIDLSAELVEEVWDDNQIPLGAASFIPGEKVQGFFPKAER